MRCEVVPSEISAILPFKQSSYSQYLNENVERTFGLISKNGLWLYLVHDTVINIYCTESGKWRGGHCFGETLKNPSAKITAAIEFTSAHISFPCLLLAVNQDHESLLCMFDVNLCKVVRAVLIPDRITSLDVVSGDGGVCVETHYLGRRLRYMFGVVALGTLNGHIFFLDLCLDEHFNCDETLPNITAVVKKQDFSAHKREAAISKNQHILLHLNVESTCGDSFEFKSKSSTLGRFAKGDVSVTAVNYLQSLTTLAVGFNFGGIQLWELHDLSLQFTISNDQHEQCIVSFAFQEPENDPRNFCYLWVIRGHSVTEEDLPTTTSVATLYSLTYFTREYIESFGALYTELQSCNRRFEFPLTNNVFSPFPSASIGSRLMSCQVISQKDVPHSLGTASANESDSISEDMSVCFLSWEVWPNSEHLPPTYHLAVFDLNQWYQAHMPSNFRCNPNELNSYLGIFSLEKVARNLNHEGIMGLYTVSQSVKKFKSLSVSEEFFYPSSLSFQLLCFSEIGLCKTSYFGFQKHLLFEVAELGPKVLLNPKEIYSSLIRSGLVSDTHGGAERTPLTVQKEMLLQLALEYHLPFFFMKCLKEWRYSDSIHECCTSKALLSWAWKRVINIKSSIDKFTLSLFNCSGNDVDKSSLKHLHNFRRQLALIDTIMNGYQKYVTPRTEQGIQELQCRRDAILSISMYLQVLLWLRSVQILPEVCEEEAIGETVVYRFSHIDDFYSLRRLRLRKLHSSLDANDVLLIDGLVKEAGISNSWLEKNGSGVYPPPGIYAALSCYLLDGVDVQLKHSLMYYLLLDVQDTNGKNVFPTELKKFPVIFGMSKSVVKLIKAFWYLDRKDSENAITKLLHPAVRISDILPWQHQKIIKSFLYLRAPQEALKYIVHMEPPQTTVQDMKLHLSVLLACGSITQAYEYQRKKQQHSYGNDLMNHLFVGCQEMQRMKDLIYLPLNSLESSAFVKFLSDSEDPRAQESLVIYHLLHCNFFEAEKVNEKLSRALMNKITSIYEATIYERTVERDALVDNLMAAISKPERCLFDGMKQFPHQVAKREESPQPLSTSVKCSAVKKMTYSDILQSLMYKVSPLASYADTSSQLKARCSYSDLPFLGPPVTPECVKQPTDFRSGGSMVAKRSRLSSSPTEFSSPAKRSRLLDNAPFTSSPLTKRKTPKNLAGDIVSLLQTPPIHRRTSSLKGSGLQSTPTITPQSILKKKTETKKQLQLEYHTAPTPPLCSEDESSEEVMLVDEKEIDIEDSADENPSRQIRFDLPDSPAHESSLPLVTEQSMVHLPESESGSVKDDDLEITKPETPSKPTQIEVKPIFNLTREPLRSQKREISFNKKVISFTSDETSMDIESSEPSKEQTVGGSVDEPRVSSFSFTLDSGIATSTKPLPFLMDMSTVDSSAYKLPDVSHLTEVPSYSQSFQRSTCLSLQTSLRSGFESVPSPAGQQKIVDSGLEFGLEHFGKTASFAAEKDDFPQGLPADPPECSVDKEILIEESSDNETFYSPCSDQSNFPQASFTFSEPRTLFPENSDSLEDGRLPKEMNQCIDYIESGGLAMESSTISNRKFVFQFSEPSIHSMETGANLENTTPTHVEHHPQFNVSDAVDVPSFTFSEPRTLSPENSDSLEDGRLPKEINQCIDYIDSDCSNRKFVFQFSEPSNDSMETGGNLVNTTPAHVEYHPQIDVSDAVDIPSKVHKSLRPSVKTFVFTKNVPTEKSAFVELQPLNLNVQQTEKVTKIESRGPVEIPSIVEKSLRPSTKTFIFTKSVPTEGITDSEIKPPVESFYVQQPEKMVETESSDVVEIPSKVEESLRPSRKTFIFTKSVSAEKTVDTETKPDESLNVRQPEKMDETESREVVEIPSKVEEHLRPPRKTFLFTKSVSAEKTVETKFPDESLVPAQTKREAEVKIESQLAKEGSKTASKYMFNFEKSASAKNIETDQQSERTHDFNIQVIESGPSTRAAHKTFVFTKQVTTSENLAQTNQINLEDTEMESSEERIKDKAEFLKTPTETYEEFSCSLQKNSSDDGLHQNDEKKTLLSSPHTEVQRESCLATKSKTSSVTDSSNILTTLPKKPSSKVKVSKAVGTTPSLSQKKKSKGKISQKTEFSFAEPTSPATPEILEAISQTPEKPLPSFMFSPPLTRGRLRRKKLDETMGSSFCSVMSESSFARPRTPPPVDPILEGIIQEKKLESKKASTSKVTKSSVKQKTSVKKTKLQSRLSSSETEKLFLSSTSFNESLSSPSKRNSSQNTSLRHSMVLRQTKAKHKPENLF